MDIVTDEQYPRYVVGHINASPEDVDFIVRAANCHDDLLEALEGVVQSYERFALVQARLGHGCFEDLPAVKNARAAIAKAWGGREKCH